MKKRIDILLVEKGLVRSRTVATELIRAGEVLVDNVSVKKPSEHISIDSPIEVKSKPPFVGRGGQKLDHALSKFKIDVRDRVVVDVGASTGGFTDCVLQRGAKKVYAIDVGRGQLAPEIREEPRVVSMEETDIRNVNISEYADLVVVDVSFISVKNILTSIVALLKEGGTAVLLIKPQFEVGKGKLGKGGVVRDESLQETSARTVVEKAGELGLSFLGMIDSPILGGSGNKEYLAYFKK